MAYIGKSPDGTGVRSRFYYTQTSGGGTSVSGSSDDGTTLTFSDGAYVDVYLNGVLLVAGTDYNTTTANTIAGLAALANGDVVEVVVYDIFTVADTVSSLNGGTFSNNVTINGDLTVDTNTLKVDSTNNRVGVGTTSPAIALETSGSLAVSDATTATKRLQLDSGASSHTINSANYGSDMMDLNVQAENLIFKTGLVGVAERMRIDSGGSVRINATANQVGSGEILSVDVGSGGAGASFAGTATTIIGVWQKTSGGGKAIEFFSQPAGNGVGDITLSTNSTAYNTSSDYRIKQGVEDMTGAIDRVKSLSPKRFQFIGDADTTVDGFLAHEAQAVVPEAVTGTKDEVDEDGNAVMQGIDQSKLVPLLTGALREAIAKIETLETKVAALEAGS
tara:strand:+ start:193 stop:1365 length:1173 start_codon:yes stop_codon:yes gene_type:complete